MPECELTIGYNGVACPPESAGMKEYAYAVDKDNIATWTATSAGLYSAFTLKTGAELIRFEIKKDSGRFHETLQGAEESLGSWDQDYEAMIASLSTSARNFMNSLNGPNMVVFAPTKSNTVLIIGKQNGARMVENEADSNSDAYGERFIVRATGENEKRNQLLDTNFDDTIAFLDGITTQS